MRFVSGHLTYKITVRPGEIRYERGVKVGQEPALRAVFENGVFDSETAQITYRWSDEDRELIEQFLLHHPECGRQRGFYVSSTDDELVPEELRGPITTAIEGGGCAFAYSEPDGTATRCGQATVDDGPYCRRHTDMLVVPVGAGGSDSDGT